ncbi:PKD domain-containing protein [Kitasatospora sp. NPDC088548]|uniref:right-handed parallel beta-helix repeat-containing protein n=1 Tax=Kitasatospora sp. NPDC088548 TaxID=3364075 RepID=UPI0038290B14
MFIRRRVGLAVAVASSAIVGITLPPVAHAEVAVLFVDNASTANCSNAGTGTQAQPYCTIQAAADAAQPGQTVQIANHEYPEQVTVKRSGLPGKPITFKADIPYQVPATSVGTRSWNGNTPPAPHGFVLSGVHDITVTGLQIMAPQEGVLVQDAERIVLDRNIIAAGDPVFNGVSSYPQPTPNVRITGKTADTTVSRNSIYSPAMVGVAVEAGVTGTVVTTNQVTRSRAQGVVVTDAPGTVVASNTFADNCRSDIVLAGNSSGASVENNVLTKRRYVFCADPSPVTDLLSVSAGSTEGTKADYNVVAPGTGGVGYSWGGTSYRTPAEFRATGQGAHDTDVDPQIGGVAGDYVPTAAEGLTDAADASAPGMLATDFYGKPRADHPKIANTGTGVGYYDRGAVELQDTMGVTLSSMVFTRDNHPLNAQFQAWYNAGWAPAGAKLDFGDGSEPIWIEAGYRSYDHDYPAAGTYTATLTATSDTGLTRTATSTVTLAPVREIKPGFSVATPDRTVARVTVTDKTSSPWPVAAYVFDFGDGTPQVVSEGRAAPTDISHDYGVAGTYTITETVADDHGRLATTSVQTYVAGPLPGVPFAGNFAGPTTHVGVFDNGRWSASSQKVSSPAGMTWQFGDPGDIPVVGAWDNVCQCRLGIYRPSTGTFALQHADKSVSTVQFGEPGDLPAVGAWDHNGHDQLAIYRQSTGTLAVRHDNGTVTTLRFGEPGDLPVVGDWDGVRHAQLGLFRPGRNAGDPNQFILRHDDGSVSTAYYGAKGDVPVVGDWLGRGRTTFGVFRPSTHVFALSNAYGGQADSVFTIYA